MSKEEVEQIVRRFRFENLDMASREATHWFRDALREVGPIYREPLLRNQNTPYKIKPGSMCFFGYSPKTKSDLQFYDIFPLTIILKKQTDNFLGLNLHYLRYYNRAVFLNFLLTYTNITEWWKQPELALINVNYSKIKNSSNLMNKFLKASIKRYDYKQIVSRVLIVKSVDWKIIPFLPLDKFIGASQEDVFKWAAKQ